MALVTAAAHDEIILQGQPQTNGFGVMMNWRGSGLGPNSYVGVLWQFTKTKNYWMSQEKPFSVLENVFLHT
jgi:hypothetical protein